jgi:hypothetical protein
VADGRYLNTTAGIIAELDRLIFGPIPLITNVCLKHILLAVQNVPPNVPSNFVAASGRLWASTDIVGLFIMMYQWLLGRQQMETNICER